MIDSDYSANEVYDLNGAADVKIDDSYAPAQRYIQAKLDDYQTPPVIWNVKDFEKYKKGDSVEIPRFIYDLALDGKCLFSDRVRNEFEGLLQDKLPANSDNPAVIVTAFQKTLEETV